MLGCRFSRQHRTPRRLLRSSLAERIQRTRRGSIRKALTVLSVGPRSSAETTENTHGLVLRACGLATKSKPTTPDEARARLLALGLDADAATVLFDHFADSERRGKLRTVFRGFLAETQGFDLDARPVKRDSGDGIDHWDANGALGDLTLAAIGDDVIARGWRGEAHRRPGVFLRALRVLGEGVSPPPGYALTATSLGVSPSSAAGR